MNMLVVPRPVFTADMDVEGYYFSYQIGNAILEAVKSNPLDGAMNTLFFEFTNHVGLEALTQNKLVFVPMTNILLITDLEQICQVEPEKVAFLLGKDIEINERNLVRAKQLFAKGFKFAFWGRDDFMRLTPFMPYVDYVFLAYDNEQLLYNLNYLRGRYPTLKLVATDIPDSKTFGELKYSGIPLFDGPFYKMLVHANRKHNTLTPLKVNYVQLLNMVNQDDFEIQMFTRVVRQDTALAIQFMRLVNSASRGRSEIRNINQAAALLGQREIKKWITTAVSTALCADKPNEVMRISLLRAKFCENLAGYFQLAMLKENLFLLGLLSILDVILEMPMKDALKMIFVPDPIQKALSEGQGELYAVLKFVIQYEYGNWLEISRQALVMNIAISDIHAVYLDAMMWYSHLINAPIDDASGVFGEVVE